MWVRGCVGVWGGGGGVGGGAGLIMANRGPRRRAGSSKLL